MKKLLLSVISIMALVIGSLFFSVSPTRVNAAVDMGESVASGYLVNGDTPYLSNLENGVGEGYGQVALGSATTLYAKAYNGFKLVGWQIVYLDREQSGEHPTRFITAAGQTKEELGDLSEENQPYYEVRYNVTIGDENYDGSLFISRVFENLQVNPVFDFKTYYNISVNHFVNIVDGLHELADYNAFYTEEQNGYYKNTIVKNGADYLYFGTTTLKEGKLYSVHYTLEEQPKQQLIDISLGAVHIGEQLNLRYQIKNQQFDKILTSSEVVNYDIHSANLACDAGAVDLSSSLTATKSDEGVTTAIQLTFNFGLDENDFIANDIDGKLALELTRDRLFYIEFVPYLDGDPLLAADNSEARKLILEQLQLTNYYYQFTDTPNYRYLIKQAEDNFGIGAQAVYPQAVYFEEDDVRYNYYQFVSANYTDLSSILTDSKIEVYYTSYKYNVNFQFVLKTEDGISILNDKSVEAPLTLARGQSPEKDIAKTDASDNLGYTFVGFAKNLAGEITTSQTISKDEITIDYTHPQDITIYMVYNYTEYSIKITGISDYKLVDGENTYYPFSYVTIYNSSVNERKADQASDFVFDCKFTLVDNFTLNFRINNGYELTSFNGQLVDSNSLRYQISDLISTLSISDTEITLKAEFVYINYSLEYYIDSSIDNSSKKSVFMGDISLELSADITGLSDTTTVNVGEGEVGPTVYGRVAATTTKTDNRITIKLTGLRMYDKVKLIAKAKVKEESTKYRFNRFLADGRYNLYAQAGAEDEHYTNYSLVRDTSVEVSFVEPTTLFEVVIADNLDAIAFDRITIISNGNQTSQLPASGQIEKLATGKTSLEFNTYSGGNGANFGYSFVEALDNGNQHINSVDSGTKITLEFNLGEEEKYTITLKFKIDDYKLKINQTNSDSSAQEDWQDTPVKFDEQEYTTVNINNLQIAFEMPTGYYANRLYADDIEYINLQTNDYFGNQFEYTLTKEDLEKLAGKISQDFVTINVEYTIHTYTLTVTFAVNSDRSQFDERVLAELPSIDINIANEQTRQGHSYVYKDIKYNTTISITVTGGIRDGLVGEGWYDKFGSPYRANADTQLLSLTVIDNIECLYRLVYKVYNIRLIKDQTPDIDLTKAGQPNSLVNGELSQQVRLFDSLSINAAAIRENGYTYNYIYFNTNQQQKSEIYSPSLNIDSFDTVNILTQQALDGSEYVEFHFVYQQLNIAVNTIYSVDTDYLQEFENEYGFVDAQFRYFRYSAGAFVEDNSLTPLHYRDIVEIEINYLKLNGHDFGYDLDEINFKDGVKLQVYIGGQLINFVDADISDQKISFNLNSVLSQLGDDNTITILFNYTVLEKQLTYTTNISDPEFYGNQTNFQLTIETIVPDTQTDLPRLEDGSFDKSFSFLTYAELTYKMSNPDYAQLLVVNSVNAYKKVEIEDEIVWQPVDLQAVGAHQNVNLEDGQISLIKYYFMSDVKIELVVQPIIKDSAFHDSKHSGGDLYTHEIDSEEYGVKVHKFYGDYLFYNPANRQDGLIEGHHQLGLSVGQAVSNNIQLDEFFARYVHLRYYTITDGLNILEQNELPLEEVVDVGKYLVKLDVADASSEDLAPLWLKQMGFGSYHIILEVRPIKLTVQYSSDAVPFTKEYNGPTGYRILQEDFESHILPYLVFVSADRYLNVNGLGEITRSEIRVDYFINQTRNPNFQFSNKDGMNPRAELTTLGENDFRQPYEASDLPYNVKLSNLNLMGNKNFELDKEAILNNAAKIDYKNIYLQNLYFRDKLFDGTNLVSIDNRWRASLTENDIMDSYDSSVNLNDLIVAHFGGENASEIGANKPIVVENLSSLLNYVMGSEIAKNYILKLANENLSASIYPDKITATIEGVGTVSLVNEIGKTNPNKVDLIGFGEQLSIEVVRIDTAAYNRIYRYISGSLKNKTYVLGYRIRLVKQGNTRFIPSELSLQLPSTKGLSGVIHLGNDNLTRKVNYTNNGYIQIDLSDINQPNLFVVIKDRALLAWWQILLIVLLVLLLIAIIVTIIVVRRVQTLKKYKKHDKI